MKKLPKRDLEKQQRGKEELPPKHSFFSSPPLSNFPKKVLGVPPPPLLIPTKSNSSNFDFVLPHTQKGEEEDDQLARLEDAHCVTTNSLFLGEGKEFATFFKKNSNTSTHDCTPIWLIANCKYSLY